MKVVQRGVFVVIQVRIPIVHAIRQNQSSLVVVFSPVLSEPRKTIRQSSAPTPVLQEPAPPWSETCPKKPIPTTRVQTSQEKVWGWVLPLAISLR